LFAAVLALAVVADAQTLVPPAPPAAIEVRAESVAAFDVRDRSRRQFGLLEFRGGLSLRSSYKNFCGMSAIRVASDGAHFIALNGWWPRGIIVRRSQPIGIVDAEMASMLGADGNRCRPRLVRHRIDRGGRRHALAGLSGSTIAATTARSGARRPIDRNDFVRCRRTEVSKPWSSSPRACRLAAR
jgi:hypothetical protein